MPWPAIVAAGLTVGGALGSGEIQRRQSLKNWNRQNAYNTPEAQIARLKQAGLPLATMFGGQGGSTSSPIDKPEVDPTLGTAQGIQAYMQTNLQKKQLQLMDQELRTKTAEADIAEHNRNHQLGRTLDSTDGKNIDPSVDQFGDSNLVLDLRRERRLKNTEQVAKDLQNQLTKINVDNTEQQIKAQVERIVAETLRINQEVKRTQNYIDALEQVTRDIQNGGTGMQGIGRLIKLLGIKFLSQ